MPQTRRGARTGSEAQQKQASTGKENQPPAGSNSQKKQIVSSASKGQKRSAPEDDTKPSAPSSKKRQPLKNDNHNEREVTSSTDNHDEASDHPTIPNVQKSESGELISKALLPPQGSDMTPRFRDPAEGMDTYNANRKSDKPPLTVEDLSFDWDRTQLRDPRATPGRKARPHYEKNDDLPVTLLEKLQKTRSVYKSERPKGRLTNAIKNDMFVAEARHNPWKKFYDLHRCYDKGREGSPTYDAAGFQLDYDKVCEWMRPVPYNKKRMVDGMNKRVDKAVSDEQQMFELFFVDVKDPSAVKWGAKDYLQDQVSKDLGIPGWQIGPGQVRLWRDKGFEPVRFGEWWKEPTREEKRRIYKMMGGAALRKEIWPEGNGDGEKK